VKARLLGPTGSLSPPNARPSRDHGVRAHAGAVGKNERDLVRIPSRVHKFHTEVTISGGTRGLDRGNEDRRGAAQKRCPEIPSTSSPSLSSLVILPLSHSRSASAPIGTRPPFSRSSTAQPAQYLYRVGRHLNARPEPALEAAGLLVDLHVVPARFNKAATSQAAECRRRRPRWRAAFSFGLDLRGLEDFAHLGISR